ncbi:hypothetical protein ACFQY4_13370 [Catellatospora bangladeshensis]|uniref:hypothetical protein n=1 Tax=Catellatospora bangladeshensis TaxID=310355 RepID=UPI00361F309B
MREPLPGVQRQAYGGDTRVTLPGGERIIGSTALALPFAVPPEGMRLVTDTVAVDDPVELLRAVRLPGDAVRLATEIRSSLAGLALARAAQPGPRAGRRPWRCWPGGPTGSRCWSSPSWTVTRCTPAAAPASA